MRLARTLVGEPFSEIYVGRLSGQGHEVSFHTESRVLLLEEKLDRFGFRLWSHLLYIFLGARERRTSRTKGCSG